MQEAVRGMGGGRESESRAAEAGVWLRLFKSVVHLLRILYERDCRLAFCPPDFWQRHTDPHLLRLSMLRKARRGAVELFSVTGNARLTREELEAAVQVMIGER